ncbi:MAG: ATP-dependent Clp protease adapter ClpS [Cellulomonadaceae bacterium]|nr:ATP-dependent Clp protease adapter ClpS [Cellulomonadaceae bacterium]
MERPEVEELLRLDQPWTVRVWNDPVNLMDYVTYVFMSHFGYPRAQAEDLMWQVHNEGSAAVATGNREQMEVHVQAMHQAGLWATMHQEG